MDTVKDIYGKLLKKTIDHFELLNEINNTGNSMDIDKLAELVVDGMILEYYVHQKNLNSNSKKGYSIKSLSEKIPRYLSDEISIEHKEYIYNKYKQLCNKKGLYQQSPYMAYYFQKFFSINPESKVKYQFNTNIPITISNLIWNWKKTPYSYDSKRYEQQDKIIKYFNKMNKEDSPENEDTKVYSLQQCLNKQPKNRKIDIEEFINEFSQKYYHNLIESFEENFTIDAFLNIALLRKLLNDKNSNRKTYVKLVSQLQILPYYDLKIYIYEKCIKTLNLSDDYYNALHERLHFIMSTFYFLYQDLYPLVHRYFVMSSKSYTDQIEKIENYIKMNEKRFFCDYDQLCNNHFDKKYLLKGIDSDKIFETFYKTDGTNDTNAIPSLDGRNVFISPSDYYSAYAINIPGSIAFQKHNQIYNYIISDLDK